MRQLALVLLTVLLGVAIWLWGLGGADQVSIWASQTQRDVQNAMAASLRSLRAGEPGALVGLWSLCFTYGFVHAAGPGHGKLVVGGYGLGVRVSWQRLVGLAAASSIAQALTAIVFVSLGLAVLGWGREQLTALADQTMAQLSYVLIIGVGLWLLFRGARKAYRLWRPKVHGHHHHLDDHGVCSECGHAHGPSLEQAEAVRSWRDAFAVIAAIAIRPCTGAVFLLVLTYALGLYTAGVIGVLIMGLGTAALTGLVALAAVGARESSLAQAASSRGVGVVIIAAELLAGAIIVLLAWQLLMRVA